MALFPRFTRSDLRVRNIGGGGVMAGVGLQAGISGMYIDVTSPRTGSFTIDSSNFTLSGGVGITPPINYLMDIVPMQQNNIIYKGPANRGPLQQDSFNGWAIVISFTAVGGVSGSIHLFFFTRWWDVVALTGLIAGNPIVGRVQGWSLLESSTKAFCIAGSSDFQLSASISASIARMLTSVR